MRTSSESPFVCNGSKSRHSCSPSLYLSIHLAAHTQKQHSRLENTRTHERGARLPSPGPLVCSSNSPTVASKTEVDVPSKEVNQLTGSATSLFSDNPLLAKRCRKASAFAPPCCATSSRSAHYYWLARNSGHPAGRRHSRAALVARKSPPPVGTELSTEI